MTTKLGIAHKTGHEIHEKSGGKKRKMKANRVCCVMAKGAKTGFVTTSKICW